MPMFVKLASTCRFPLRGPRPLERTSIVSVKKRRIRHLRPFSLAAHTRYISRAGDGLVTGRTSRPNVFAQVSESTFLTISRALCSISVIDVDIDDTIDSLCLR